MKKVIFILTVVLISVSVNAQKVEKATIKTNTSDVVKKEHPLKNFYEKKMKIDLHSKGDVKVEHKRTDYVTFYKDGNYMQEFMGLSKKGTWTYNADSNTITITLDGGHRFKVTEVSATALKLTKDTEILNVSLME